MYRWLIIITGLCVVLIWLYLLHSTNNYFMSAYNNIKQLQYDQLESKFIKEVHNDTLVNLDNFEFVLNNATLCVKGSSTEIDSSVVVIMVHSARNNFDQRYAIRSTWGSVKEYKKWHFHLIFLLGSHPNDLPENSTDSRLLDESKENGDIIMGNFIDSYRNLTYKHLMGYKWVSTFCPNAKYILKTDDDIYADLFQVMDVILEELRNSNKTFACENMGGNKPCRGAKEKWYVPKDVYPEDTYPAFCSGSAYLMRAEDALRIYSVSNKINFLWIDDVFVTGVLREKYDFIVNNRSESSLQILTIYNRHHLSDKKEIINWCASNSMNQLNYAFILLTKEGLIRDMFCIWNKVRLMRFAMNVILDPKTK